MICEELVKSLFLNGSASGIFADRIVCQQTVLKVCFRAGSMRDCIDCYIMLFSCSQLLDGFCFPSVGARIEHSMSLSKTAVPAVNRRARSARSASGQSDVGEDTTQTLAELGLDVVGEDDVEKQLWIMVGKKQVMQFPDGRKCILCPFRDNMWCPTAMKLHQLKRYVR